MAKAINNNQQQPAVCKTRDEMLAKFLTDDSLNDIILKGTDGVQVPANRFLLSARSDVFKGMLLGKFQEASLPVVELSFTGSVLQAVAEFVLTDDAQILNSKKRKTPDGEEEEEHVSIQQIESLVSLTEAASYFNLAGLEELVMEYCTTILKKWPCLSFAFLQVCRTAGNSVPDVVLDKAKRWVRETPAKSVSTDHVAALSKVVMEEILMDAEMKMTECDLFQILSLWVEGEPSHRKDAGKCLSTHICFEKIDAQFLATAVASSGLATSQQLNEAYKNQALKLAPSSFPKRCEPSWVSEKPFGAGMPSAIKVEGGGIDPVNGVYIQDGLYMKKPKYLMQGSYKGRIPVAIKVEGAGTEAVNGVYTQDGLYKKKPKYVMQCSYQGEQRVFALAFHGVYWYVEIPCSANGGLVQDVDFYKVKLKPNQDFPPSTGWKTQGNGAGSPPNLLYKFEH